MTAWNSFCSYAAPMLLTGMVYGAVSGLLAASLQRLLRLNAAARCILWQVVLYSTLILPAFLHLNITPAHSNETAAVLYNPAMPQDSGVFWISNMAASFITSAWTFGTAILLIRWAVAIVRVLQMKRRARTVAFALPERPRGVSVAMSEECGSPMTVGYIRPRILVPPSLAASLSAMEFQQILAHELAHVRRYDDWGKLLQRALQAILFFNPFVFWLGRRLDLDREIACDDRVVKNQKTSVSYAKCLIHLAELITCPNRDLPAAGVLYQKSQLSTRIELLVENRRKHRAHRGWTALLAVVGFSWIFVSYATPLVGVTEQDEPGSRNSVASSSSDWKTAQEAARAAREESLRAREEMQQTKEMIRAQSEAKRKTADWRRALSRFPHLESAAPRPALESQLGNVAPALAPMPPVTPTALPVVPRTPLPPVVPSASTPVATPGEVPMPAPVIAPSPLPPLPPQKRGSQHIQINIPNPQIAD